MFQHKNPFYLIIILLSKNKSYKHICEIPLNYILREKFYSTTILPVFPLKSIPKIFSWFATTQQHHLHSPPLHLSLLSTRLEFQLSRLPAYYCKLYNSIILQIYYYIGRRNIPQMLTHHQQFTMGAVSTNTTPTKHSIANIHTITR